MNLPSTHLIYWLYKPHMLSILVWNSVRLISSSHAELLEKSIKEETQLIAAVLAPGLLANDIALLKDSFSLSLHHQKPPLPCRSPQ